MCLADEKRLKVLDEGIVFGLDAQEGNVTVENVSAEVLMFKVKTTNPDKFRVSPPAGIIRPKQLERITVTMVHGHRVEEASARDKFLIMCKPLEEGVSDDFVPIDKIHKDFKQASSADIEQHRIRCIYPANAQVDGGEGMTAVRTNALRNGLAMRFSPDGDDRPRSSNQVRTSGSYVIALTDPTTLPLQMMDLHATVTRLERQVGRVQTLLFILLAIIFLLIGLVAVYLPQLGYKSEEA